MKKRTVVIIGLLNFLLGLAVGFFASLVKQGVSIGNDSGNTIHNYYGALPDETGTDDLGG